MSFGFEYVVYHCVLCGGGIVGTVPYPYVGGIGIIMWGEFFDYCFVIVGGIKQRGAYSYVFELCAYCLYVFVEGFELYAIDDGWG